MQLKFDFHHWFLRKSSFFNFPHWSPCKTPNPKVQVP